MAAQKPRSRPQPVSNKEGITRITVAGFKSISQEQSIEIRPLTILAGANSSGKSSMMQPLLLLKQTLEAPYDPGALLLDGPNVRFTSAEQLLSRTNNGKSAKHFFVSLQENIENEVTTFFIRSKIKGKGFDVEQTIYRFGESEVHFYQGMSPEEVLSALSATFLKEARPDSKVFLTPNRCFLTFARAYKSTSIPTNLAELILNEDIPKIIHLPGLRGNPARTYPVTAVGTSFPGTFENYVASVIGQWQVDDHYKLAEVNSDLARLGLTGKVLAKPINDTQVEILVNRLLRSNKGSNEDMVSIADVGLGISQTLPVVVALHAANQGQLVYLEQPEIHLHPRAQTAMAEVLADAALQGKRLVVETHSNLLLRGVQTLVAEGKLPPELVKLHWFTLNEDGSTRIDSADLDEAGAFGDWPEDFHSVTLQAESRYIDAAEARLMGE